MQRSRAETKVRGGGLGVRCVISTLMLMVIMTLTGCESGSDEEVKFQKALSTINENWEIYEMTKKGNMTIIRVEVDDNVPFKIAKKASDAIQKADPQFNGYIEFFNSEVGMVLRKLEIFPAT